MASLTLKNIKKIYPHNGDEAKQAKKKKKKNQDEPEKEKANLQVTEQGVIAVQEFNLDIADKEFIVLVGPSGCGKSTTLRMIAGLEEITGGELYIGDRLVNDVAPKDRDIAMVFQNYALYPHMTVYDNLAFALKLRHAPKDEIDRKVKEAAEILTNYMTDYPGLTANDFSSLLYYKLLSEQEKGYEEYWDVSSDISDRIRKHLFEFKDYDSFCGLLKTKEVTYTRISRCLLHILLNITKDDMELGQTLDYVPYARVLGFRKDATPLLSAIKENSTIPLITKLADAQDILPEAALSMLEQDIKMNSIYESTAALKAKRSIKNEYRTPIVIV